MNKEITQKYITQEHEYLKEVSEKYSIPFPVACMVAAYIKTAENNKIIEMLRSVELENYLKS